MICEKIQIKENNEKIFFLKDGEEKITKTEQEVSNLLNKECVIIEGLDVTKMLLHTETMHDVEMVRTVLNEKKSVLDDWYESNVEIFQMCKETIIAIRIHKENFDKYAFALHIPVNKKYTSCSLEYITDFSEECYDKAIDYYYPLSENIFDSKEALENALGLYLYFFTNAIVLYEQNASLQKERWNLTNAVKDYMIEKIKSAFEEENVFGKTKEEKKHTEMEIRIKNNVFDDVVFSLSAHDFNNSMKISCGYLNQIEKEDGGACAYLHSINTTMSYAIDIEEFMKRKCDSLINRMALCYHIFLVENNDDISKSEKVEKIVHYIEKFKK